jgi:Peptidase A4 family
MGTMRLTVRRRALARAEIGLIACAATTLGLATSASAALRSHGDLVHPFKPHVGFHTNQSTNWFGYNQGTIEQGTKLFHSISGTWTVPTATQHRSGTAGFSATWLGIGGGCVDTDCLIGDNTLIQTGTEQDVDANGKASYSAWWEIIPAPGIDINMKVAPGDRMYASIVENPTGSEIWTITLKNLTRGETFSTTVPYTSTYGSAEWIDETPVVIGLDGTGFTELPNLTKHTFDTATTNGAPANLKPSEEMQLVDSNDGHVIATPSAPDAQNDGFAECAWASTCAVPTTSTTTGKKKRAARSSKKSKRSRRSRRASARAHRRG